MLPQFDESIINNEIEHKISLMQSAIIIARLARDKKKIPVRRPLKELVIVCSPEVKEQISTLVPYIESEVNVLDIKFETEEKKYVKFSAVPDGKTLGKRLRNKLASFKKALLEVPFEKMAAIYEETIDAKMNNKPAPEFEVDGIKVNTDEVQVLRELINPDEKKYAGGTDGEVVALVDITSSKEIEEMTVAREIRSRIQAARKFCGCVPTDKVKIYFNVLDSQEESRKERCRRDYC